MPHLIIIHFKMFILDLVHHLASSAVSVESCLPDTCLHSLSLGLVSLDVIYELLRLLLLNASGLNLARLL